MRSNTLGPDSLAHTVVRRPRTVQFVLDVRGLGKAISAHAQIEGVTLAQAAQAVGVSPATMWRLQAGRLADPSAGMLGKVCGWMGISPERFYRMEKGRKTG